MTDPSPPSPAGAGLTLVAAILLGGGIGLGLGALVGLAAPLAIAGVFIGFGGGLFLVFTRFRNV